MLILFGDITNTFVSGGLDPDIIKDFTCSNYNISYLPPGFNETYVCST